VTDASDWQRPSSVDSWGRAVLPTYISQIWFKGMIMRFRNFQFFLFMAALAASATAGIAWGEEDYLAGGYVASLDRSGAFEPGISGMVKWLDMPVPYSTFVPYREYYVAPLLPRASIISQMVDSPVQYNITGRTPSGMHYGNGQVQTYSSYTSSLTVPRNDLWIAGRTNWTQYAVIPVGASLKLLASAPSGGSGGFYKVIQTNSLKTDYQSVQFNPGYNSMNFWAGQTGRYMIYFVVNNMPSNVIIVDVLSQAPG
jgi:hypothetical protein